MTFFRRRGILVSMTTVPARCIGAACALMLLAFPAVGEGGLAVRFPVSALSVPADGAVWVPPPPAETPILDGIPEGRGSTVAHYGSLALMTAGGLLCAGGIAMAAEGLSDDMNPDTMHSGALMIISGAVTAAIFSVISRATGHEPEPLTSQE